MCLLMWGTGRLAGKVLGRYISLDSVAAFVDNDESKTEFMGKSVIRPKDISRMEYDAIVVANLYSAEISAQCSSLGLDPGKIIYLYQNCFLEDMNKDYGFVGSVLGEKYSEIIRQRYHVVRQVDCREPLCLNDWQGERAYLKTDHVRMKCFELAVRELRKRKLSGAVAEVGVFRGEFAQFINFAFPEKKLYLFDTFDGFDANEALNEIKSGNCTEAFVKAYKQTNIAAALQRMTYPEQVIIKQGFFPESLGGLEERFAFVSLDMDLEDSIYAGLEYFYPRLETGGYIFIHDYSSDLRGVEKAVDRYELTHGISLCKVPLCDANGTLVVTK